MSAVITKHQANKLEGRDLERILGELESLSEDDARRLLSDYRNTASTEDGDE
jgi:hypothetical protein